MPFESSQGSSPLEQALVIGAGQGIGLEFVRQWLQAPSIGTVFATTRHLNQAVGLQKLQQLYPDQLKVLEVDITQEAQIAIAVAHIQANCDRLHWVINCVGILHEAQLQPEKALRQAHPENLMRYFQVNSIGHLLWAKHLLPLLKHGDRSVLASISAKVGSIGDNRLGGWYGYRASKAALNMFMKTTALEYSRRSPQTIVALLHPGTTDTELSRPFQSNVPPEKLFSVERTVTQLRAVLSNLTPSNSGEFFSWDGQPLPW